MADFAPCIAFTLGQEGGYSDDPLDPGGPTNHGIALAELQAWRGHRCTAADVRALGQAEAVAIYRAHYWLPVAGPQLPAGLDLVVFEFGVNAGAITSARFLLRVLGVAQDGQVGPVTLARAQGTALLTRTRIQALVKVHEAYYHALAGWPHDGRGWTARCNAALAAAMALTVPAKPGSQTTADPANMLNGAELNTIEGA